MVAITRNSNPLIFIPPIAFGALFAVGTIIAAIFLKPGIEERMKKPLPVENLSRGIQIEALDREIKSKDDQIRFEQQRSNVEKQLSDSRRKLDELKGKKQLPDSTKPELEQEKTVNIKRLEDEKVQLAARRDAIAAQVRASKSRSWIDWFADLEIGLALKALLPLGVLSFYFVRMMFSSKLPRPNPFSLTNFEKKSVLFFITSILVSAFGFFSFVWILSVKNNFSI